MPYITITADTEEGLITLQERVMPSHMESEFFCAYLVERLRWAVEDAHVTMPQPTSIATTGFDRLSSTPGLVADTERVRRDAGRRPPIDSRDRHGGDRRVGGAEEMSRHAVAKA